MRQDPRTPTSNDHRPTRPSDGDAPEIFSMAYLDIDFIIPAAIMASAIIGVLMIRKAVRQGAERARRRTAKLIAELDSGP